MNQIYFCFGDLNWLRKDENAVNSCFRLLLGPRPTIFYYFSLFRWLFCVYICDVCVHNARIVYGVGSACKQN